MCHSFELKFFSHFFLFIFNSNLNNQPSQIIYNSSSIYCSCINDCSTSDTCGFNYRPVLHFDSEKKEKSF